jgi:hypothetical protein
MVRIANGFLLLAGPVGDQPGTYPLYEWNGTDALQGKADQASLKTNRKLLGRIPARENTKAEGLALVREDNASYEIVVVYDGEKNGGARRFRIAKPAP